jgi:predicted outer membrane repeat protein
MKNFVLTMPCLNRYLPMHWCSYLACVVSALLLNAADTPAATLTVTNGNDDGPGSLRQAVLNASFGDLINFAAGITTISLTSDELLINKNLTINGPGANLLTVQRSTAGGTPEFRIFSIASGADVTISDLTIRNGRGYNSGGILNNGATLTVNNCVLTANSAGGYGGGGIMNDGSSANASLNVNNCVFDGNSADFQGGGILNFTTSSTSANLTVRNCTVGNNSAQDGGGIVSYPGFNGTATAIVSNTTMTGNSAEFGRGGAIHNDSPVVGGSATLTVSNCTISGNSAHFYGGGVGNSAGIVQISNCTLSGNSASGSGGGISTEYDDAQVYISNCTLSGNSADVYGGGIYSQERVTVAVTNSTLSGNSANSGGGIYNNGSSGGTVATLANTILKTGASGENIYNFGGSVVSQGYNLSNDNGSGYLNHSGDQINTDPVLGPLQDNGGPTFTHALLPGSPAIDAGDPNFTPPPLYDQRGPGYPRVVNGRIDKGSFEVQAPHPSFFTGEIALQNGVYYLQFPNGSPFGYYSYLTDPRFIYHFDMGYEYWFDANDGHSGIFFYDFMSNHFFYTSPSFPFPYLYDFSLNAVLYYYPDPNNPGHYTTNPRYFYNFATGQIITM